MNDRTGPVRTRIAGGGARVRAEPFAAGAARRPATDEEDHRMRNINRAMLLGHAGRDAELCTLPDGGRAATFSLATTERWNRRDGEAAEGTEWHRIVVYGAAVEAVEARVRKGAAALVEGRLGNRRFTDRDGRDREIAEVVVAGPGGTVDVLSPGAAPDGSNGAEAPDAEGEEAGSGADEENGAAHSDAECGR